MIDVQETDAFSERLHGLRDDRARVRALIRIKRLASGDAANVRPVGDGVSETRIHYGPGCRVYFLRRGEAVAILLGGGDKRSQERDLESARALAREISL